MGKLLREFAKVFSISELYSTTKLDLLDFIQSNFIYINKRCTLNSRMGSTMDS